MAARVCAYCGSEQPLTKEHLWPASLHRRLLEANDDKENCFWLRRVGRELPSEPTVRDVCAECNNGPLSLLDSYMCELFDGFLVRSLDRDEAIDFKFDYHRLKRWLLKMSFNSARIHAAEDCYVFAPLLPYIRGDSDSAGRSVQLYLQLAYPSMVKDDDGKDFLFRPSGHRVGHMWFNLHGVGRKVLRAVHLRAFSFYLAFYRPQGDSATMRQFTTAFLASMKSTVLLRPSRPRLSMYCNGSDAWESFNGARENSLQYGASSS